MAKKFKPQDVAAHRSTYKKILSDGRVFVGTTMLDNFTPALYRAHIKEMIDRLGHELAFVAEESRDEPKD